MCGSARAVLLSASLKFAGSASNCVPESHVDRTSHATVLDAVRATAGEPLPLAFARVLSADPRVGRDSAVTGVIGEYAIEVSVSAGPKLLEPDTAMVMCDPPHRGRSFDATRSFWHASLCRRAA